MRTSPLKRLGRQKRFRHPDHFNALVDSYILECEVHDQPPGLAALALYLGMASRQTLETFADKNPEYAEPYARGKTLCEMYLEAVVATPQPNIGGVQQLLKTLHGHAEKQIVETTPLTILIDGKDAEL
jgi:hypothetical protein